MPHPGMLGALHLAAIVTGLLFYVSLRRRGRQYRTAAAALAWVMALVVFPYIALPLFFLLGRRKERGTRPIAWPRNPATGLEGAQVHAFESEHLGRAEEIPPPRAITRFALDESGEVALSRLLALLDGAEEEIALSIFILTDDAAGHAVQSSLIAAADRGVRVRVLLDRMGTARHLHRIHDRLEAAGVKARAFGAVRGLRSLATGNLRSHRKFAVVDGNCLWSGGRNIAEAYFPQEEEEGWIDLSYVVEGAVAADALALFDRQWGEASSPHQPPVVGRSGKDVMLVPSGPDFTRDTAYDLLLQAVHRADNRIWMVTPYFVPDDAFLHALLLAARRGVQIRLVLPARSNHPLADIARRRSLRDLAAEGTEILSLARMCHAKAVIIDEAWVMSGSMNLDTRSFFLNYELSCLFLDPSVVAQFDAWHARLAANGVRCQTAHATLIQDLYEGMVRAIAFQL